MLKNALKTVSRNRISGMFAIIIFAGPFQALAANATTSVPAHTLFQAHKIIQMQYPGASQINAKPYQSISISGTVGKVLNASTEIEFELEGQTRKVVMLPDGQHLLLGTIIKPTTSESVGQSLEVKASQTVYPTPNHTTPEKKVSTSNNPMDQYRLTLDGIDTLPGEQPLTPESLMTKVEEHEALITGNGPKHLYVFTDPNCPNCRNEYLSSKDHLDSFTFHWIPIYGVTAKPQPQQIAVTQDSEDANLANLDKIMTNPQSINLIKFEIEESVAIRLRDHQQLFYNLKDKRTPVTLYRNAQNTPTMVNGYSNRLYSFMQDDMTEK